MKRLTERDEYGNADIIGVGAELQLDLAFEEMNRVTKALNRLAAYEETGFTPEEIKELSSWGRCGESIIGHCNMENVVSDLQSENARLKDTNKALESSLYNAEMNLSHMQSLLDKAVEDLENLIDCHCACSYCANLMPDGTCEAERKYGVCTCLPKWRGLEESE